MSQKKASFFHVDLGLGAHGLIWFGAAVSLAEIMTGSLFAPLGLTKGLIAILLGHLIGGILLFACGLVGARFGEGAMRSTSLAFGTRGAKFFAFLNIIQLVGWTAVMIAGGAACANGLFPLDFSLWCVIIGGLIILWAGLGLKNVGWLNAASMTALFIVTLIASLLIFEKISSTPPMPTENLSFGAALELSIAMPLSWLPLIGDYTCHSHRPVSASIVCASVYSLTSSWMYFMGLGLALYAGNNDLVGFLSGHGFGITALLVVLLSTVTTTFLDVHSSGESAGCLFSVPSRPVGIATAVFGTLLALCASTGAYEEFLYYIGSAFGPMCAILVTDALLLHRDASKQRICKRNLLLWIVGFFLYRVFLLFDTPLGNSLPVILILIALRLLSAQFEKKRGLRSLTKFTTIGF